MGLRILNKQILKSGDYFRLSTQTQEGRRRGYSCMRLEQLTAAVGFEDGGRGLRVKACGWL